METNQTGFELIDKAMTETHALLKKNCIAVKSVMKSAETVKRLLINERSNHLTLADCRQIKDLLDAYNKKSIEYVEILINLTEVLDIVETKVQKSLQFFNPDGAPTYMRYHSGDPWNLMLNRKPNRITEIRQVLMEMYESNKLVYVTEPAVYDVICVRELGAFFRGVVLQIMKRERLAVLNIDENAIRVLPMKDVFELPSRIMDIPVQIVKCSLPPLSEELKPFWCKEADDLFVSVISKSSLSVTVAEQLKAEMPPVFSVIITAECSDVHIDIDKWLSDSVYPVLKTWKNTPPSFNVVKALYPFKSNVPKTAKPIKAESSANDNKSDVSNVGVIDSPNFTDSEVNSLFTHTPSVHAAVVMSHDNEDITVIKHYDNEYEPKDESEYCYLFLQNKRCWKSNCKKLHTLPSGKWTDDKMETFCTIMNRINLPNLLQEVTFQVVEIASPNAFYVYLHHEYSNTGDSSEDSLSYLEKDLNSITNVKKYKSYSVDPSLGEILLVQSDLKGYQRAKVVEIFDHFAYVFLIDYGVFNTVPLPKLRKIEQQFLHLPAQAIYTTLENANVIPKMKELAKAFITYVLKGKFFRAKIIRRNVIESELSVEIYLKDSTCLSQVLIDKGYCEKLP